MIWAGTEKGLNEFIALLKGHKQTIKQISEGSHELSARADLDDYGPAPETIDIQGSVGIISISGGMQRRESWWTRLIGTATYEGIQNAIAELADDRQISSIILNIDSPGGVVDGLAPLSRFVTDVDKRVKPVYAFTGGSMCSAAYWLSAGTRRVYADENSRIGSIGVLAIHQEYVKMLEDAGITVNVFRSAPYKALGNPYEKLSEKGKTQIQDEIGETHLAFCEAIAKGRGLELAHVEKNIASGKVFNESTALTLKMIDAKTSLVTLTGKLAENAGNTKSPFYQPNGSRAEANMANKSRRNALSPSLLAALALGADVPVDARSDATTIVADDQPTPTPAASDTPAPVVTDTVKPEDTGKTKEKAEDTPAAPAAVDTPAAPAAAANDAVTTLLQTQLADAQKQNAELQAKILTLTAEADKVKAERDNAAAGVTALSQVVQATIERQGIALGVAVVGLDKMSAEALVAQYTELDTKFKTAFKVGRQSASDDTPAPEAGSNNNVSAIRQAQMRAGKLPTRR